MAKQDLGKKRRCASCGMKFYDFNKTKITCPSCQAPFDPDQLLKSRRGRAAKSASPVEVESEAADSDDIMNDDDAEETESLGGEESFVPITGDSNDEEESGALLDENVDEDFIDEIEEDANDDEDV